MADNAPAPQYGFTEDADVGSKGDRVFEAELGGRFGKRDGIYRVWSQTASAKFTVTDRLRIAPVVSFEHHRIAGVTGINDHDRWDFAALAFEARYRLIDSTQAPFSLSVGAVPYWRRVDSAAGESAREFGSGFLLAAESELIAKRLYGAFNLTYGLGSTRLHATDAFAHSSGIGAAGSLALAIARGFFVNGELRYERAYDGLGLDRFAGEAWFAGPGFAIQLTDAVQLSAAWNIQVAGRAAGDPERLDLANFERHLVKVKLGASF